MKEGLTIIKPRIIKAIIDEIAIFPILPLFHKDSELSGLAALVLDQKQFTLEGNSTLEERIQYYQGLWRDTFHFLFERFLPHSDPDSLSIGFEMTPFSYMLATEYSLELNNLFELTEMDLNYIDLLLLSWAEAGWKLPAPSEQLDFALKITCFPPLMALSTFYRKAYHWNVQNAEHLLSMVVSKDVRFPSYENNFALQFTDRFISQETYRSIGGVEGLISNPGLSSNTIEKLKQLKNIIPKSKQVQKRVICPTCGDYHDQPTIHHDDILYAHLLEDDPNVQIEIGFNWYEEFRLKVRNEIEKLIRDPSTNINIVKDPTCVILVEGATEELALPQMALRIGMPLSLKNILVLNCKSKEKVLEQFRIIRSNFPELKICVLLDSDAEKEKRELEKMMEGKRDKFSLTFIPKGTFEDLVPLPIVVASLNELYPAEKGYEESDFKSEKGVLHDINHLVWQRGNSKLDKVKFISEAVRRMGEKDVPNLIWELIKEAYKLSGANIGME
ncbi:hypothetical protein B1A99_24860 [Cohnella sp. CIP 111063]|uniref:TOPRIM nucleotidyl transferase/hydrolase domain-containing protein n=1 Tax=unclassified Cohnella TaxID=2636738 RepID=UPI000B8BD455|nr:hypothetical protein B1A99_24860 [Cohnella sp. CIP 111063]PRX65147.1 hypothetical protein B0G52_11898 [Cohnella sp. SGD-V74]